MSGDDYRRREFIRMVTQAGIAVELSSGAALAGQGNRELRDQMITNDGLALTPVVEFPGRRLSFDFPAVRIGVAEYTEGPTGCTVFQFAKTARCLVDVRGGSPGTIMAGDGPIDALCYTGGSIYGLEAVTGVMAELFAQRGYARQFNEMAIVRGAVIFDFPGRANSIYPDKALGRAAVRAARPGIFPLGRHGAGCSATVGKVFDYPNQREPAGQGGAFRQVGLTKVAVFCVVNAVGAIVDRTGQVVRGNLDKKSGRRLPASEDLDRRLKERASASGSGTAGNTTLTVVITNQQLDPSALTPLARQVHSSMARAIQPFHAWNDGDVLYAITTGEVANPALDITALGIIASELAWDAVLNCFQD
jgi:L-aminopeptidase/D-esterase-like protein